MELWQRQDDFRSGVLQQRDQFRVRVVWIHGADVGVGRHRAQNTHRHLETIGHQDGDAFTFHSDLLQAPRKAGDRALVLGECQAALLADQSQAIGRPSGNILQGVKDCGITGCVSRNC